MSKRAFEFGSGWKRTLLEAVLGGLISLPIGVCLYFVTIIVWAQVIMTLAIPVLLIPHAGSVVMEWMDFTRGMTSVLFGGAVLAEFWICRALLLRRFFVLAYTQAILSLAISLPFFYWTGVHQKPMLPFWGQ